MTQENNECIGAEAQLSRRIPITRRVQENGTLVIGCPFVCEHMCCAATDPFRIGVLKGIAKDIQQRPSLKRCIHGDGEKAIPC